MKTMKDSLIEEWSRQHERATKDVPIFFGDGIPMPPRCAATTGLPAGYSRMLGVDKLRCSLSPDHAGPHEAWTHLDGCEPRRSAVW